ncbi:MAG: hypothetical protein ABUL73_04595 [Alphaproteobacteria bacterium]
MAIQPPTIFLSGADKELIALIARLLLDQFDGEIPASNLRQKEIALTDAEASELLSLLEQFVDNPIYQSTVSFVDDLTLRSGARGLAAFGSTTHDRARGIFLRLRSQRGRKEALGSIHWTEYLARLGLDPPTKVTKPMTFDHFVEMEHRLFRALGLHPRVCDLLVRLLASRQTEAEALRTGENSSGVSGIARARLSKIVTDLKHSETASVPPRTVSLQRLAAVATLAADTGVLFTSRDWGVAGTISTIAGSIILASKDGRDSS